ncbi:MAG: hypothetical protein HQL31_10365, partial [Planctomycetes bacterium]|nr:hypothetical protein [Planctomycetota bacterium]
MSGADRRSDSRLLAYSLAAGAFLSAGTSEASYSTGEVTVQTPNVTLVPGESIDLDFDGIGGEERKFTINFFSLTWTDPGEMMMNASTPSTSNTYTSTNTTTSTSTNYSSSAANLHMRGLNIVNRTTNAYFMGTWTTDGPPVARGMSYDSSATGVSEFFMTNTDSIEPNMRGRLSVSYDGETVYSTSRGSFEPEAD